jgi:hypothetical protein
MRFEVTMKKLNVILFIICVNFFGSAVLSQTAKFDIVTYTAPKGWSVEKDADSIRFTKELDGKYCVISLTRSADGIDDSRKNFDLLWKAMAEDTLNAVAKPEIGTPGDKDGWRAEVGIGAFEKEGLKGAAMLSTFTGGGKVVAILVLTNSDEYLPAIETFVDNLKLPPISAQKAAPSAAPATEITGDAAKLIGRWQRSGSVHPTYADPVSWGTAGYTKSRYEFKADGTYLFTERSFRMSMSKIIIVKESGRYSVSGSELTVIPAKSVIQSYSKAGGVDALGTLLSSENRGLEKSTYKFTFHYFSGIQEWNLVLQAGSPTRRDGAFSNNTTFPNAWYFDQKYIDTDLTAVRPE